MGNEQPVVHDYTAPGIVVHWQPDICQHSAECTRALPQVFKPEERPWIVVDAADADDIAAAIDRCPSGALSYTRTGPGGTDATEDASAGTAADEPAGAAVVVTVMADGPNVVRGPVEVRTNEGELIRTADRVALCRCGASDNKPFCDGSHVRVGFTDPG
ncbi:MAG: (4Fe-4S)-binding protein [Acidimicrobiales bacterium]